MASPVTNRVSVVGAGVLGAVIAWRLAQAGHIVTIHDPNPGGGASSGSLAWLNASFAEDPTYNALRHDSLTIWATLKAETPDLPIVLDGAILWEQEHFDLPAILASQTHLGRPAQMLDRRDHLTLEPEVPDAPEASLACLGDGYGDPLAITQWFLDRAQTAGAELAHEDVLSIRIEDDRATGIETAKGTAPADHVILAAGTKLPHLLAPLGLGLAMDNQPGLLVTTTPAPIGLTTMLATDGLHGWQGRDGRFLIGADFGGGGTIDEPDAFARDLVEDLTRLIPSAKGCEVERITVRERPMPGDGRPAIGPIGPGGLYMVCTHSGMTLAPVIGEMVAREVGGTEDPRLMPYRPDRPSLKVAL